MVSPPTIPPLSQLPTRHGDPPLSAWGLWGQSSALGSLNWLDQDNVLSAASEIQTGERVGLNLPLDFFDPPLLGRAPFRQQVIDKAPLTINDDVITFNTQGSSQWDSFRHFAYQEQKVFYEGTTQNEIYEKDRTSINGMQSWASQGIVARGVLIDFASWADHHGVPYRAFEGHGISIDVIDEIAKAAGISFRRGDILLLRTGYVKAYKTLSAHERSHVATIKAWTGFGQSLEAVEWLWDKQFAAVASDSPGFESRPPVCPKYHLHPILLAGWGTPIGELFDLEALSELCQRNNRWTFFLTSAPLNYDGAVASPPNAIAII